MYHPVKDGVAKTTASVVYTEAPPPAVLGDLVHCFWELRTETELAEDFTLHALPDACVNPLFNQLDTQHCRGDPASHHPHVPRPRRQRSCSPSSWKRSSTPA